MAERGMVFYPGGDNKPPDTAVYDEEQRGWLLGWTRVGPYTENQIMNMGGVLLRNEERHGH